MIECPLCKEFKVVGYQEINYRNKTKTYFWKCDNCKAEWK